MKPHELQTLYGLKYNPFLPTIPPEALWIPPGAESFFVRLQQLIRCGGFSAILGEPGLGKSKLLHVFAGWLDGQGDVVVRLFQRPQSSLSDFYRELGDLYGVNLSPWNRYGGFKSLRVRWRNHIKSTLYRPVLLIDEAQEVSNACLNELRLLSSAHFDSEILLTVVLCGDSRLLARFRQPDLLPLGSRIQTRLMLHPWSKADLQAYLEHSLEQAGAPTLMTPQLQQIVVEQSAGNLRILAGIGAQMLAVAVQRNLPRMDESLYLELYSRTPPSRRKRS